MKAGLAAAFLFVGAVTATAADYRVQTDDLEGFEVLLRSVGLEAIRGPSKYRIVVGDSPAAREAGFAATAETVRVAAVTDLRDPELPIFWQEPLTLPVFSTPAGVRVFAVEKSSGAPLLAGVSVGDQTVLWAAALPGASGYDRFPYLIHALADLGLDPPFRGDRTWLFFDYGYRVRADPEYLAQRWRKAGTAGLHVSAWPFWEPDEARDAYLDRLIAACRRQAILVYAWLEPPHISDEFWANNPDCRERTAAGQDAQLDWRKLANLSDPQCAERIRPALTRVLKRFDWDGVNLAELYFESLLGPADPERFTPMNDWVRADAAKRLGFDPIETFNPASPHHWERGWKPFADYRTELALSLQTQWIEWIREDLPEGDLVLTQIDTLLDQNMRFYLGADAGAALMLSDHHTLMIEDPSTLWALGPERYPEIARRYEEASAPPDRLAIDVNIVERGRPVYPTRKQTGGELLRLASEASAAFRRLALYFEHSLAKPDLPLLPAAAIGGARVVSASEHELIVESPVPVGVRFDGPALVDGKPWPVADRETVWLPAGRHGVQSTAAPLPGRILRLNADLLSASTLDDGVVFRYHSRARALALLDRKPAAVLVDGEPAELTLQAVSLHWFLELPRGKHEITVIFV